VLFLVNVASPTHSLIQELDISSVEIIYMGGPIATNNM